MVRGPKKHLKRLAAPKAWMLDKLGGAHVTRPCSGPHKLRESMPVTVFLRNRLKYALTGKFIRLFLCLAVPQLGCFLKVAKSRPF